MAYVEYPMAYVEYPVAYGDYPVAYFDYIFLYIPIYLYIPIMGVRSSRSKSLEDLTLKLKIDILTRCRLQA